MRKHLYSGMALGVLFSGQALANEKLTLVLDWYINPDHAPIVVAEQIGAFKDAGLDVKIVPPSDPALPPRLVAARQADLAITYQPQVHFFADEGLPLVRVGTLINSPLNTVIALDKSIKSPADLQGKKVGYSVSGIEQATLATMAQGAWRKTGATRVLAAIDARMGEVYWAEYQRDEQGVWHGEETEAVLKPDAVAERLAQLSGEWATVGTGWQAWPDLAKESGLTLSSGEIELPAAEDMLPLACYLLAAGKTVAVEKAEPVYLRNEVAWKKLPGRE